jgi:hypothetical protein
VFKHRQTSRLNIYIAFKHRQTCDPCVCNSHIQCATRSALSNNVRHLGSSCCVACNFSPTHCQPASSSRAAPSTALGIHREPPRAPATVHSQGLSTATGDQPSHIQPATLHPQRPKLLIIARNLAGTHRPRQSQATPTKVTQAGLGLTLGKVLRRPPAVPPLRRLSGLVPRTSGRAAGSALSTPCIECSTHRRTK